MGTVMLALYNTWSKSWRVLVTIIGWLALIKGAVLMLFPQVMTLYVNFLSNTTLRHRARRSLPLPRHPKEVEAFDRPTPEYIKKRLDSGFCTNQSDRKCALGAILENATAARHTREAAMCYQQERAGTGVRHDDGR